VRSSTGGVEVLGERRREAALRRKAARLVEAELNEAESAFEAALDEGRMWAEPPSVPSWKEYAPVLPDALNTSDWQVVESAVAIVRLAPDAGEPIGPEGTPREHFEQSYRLVVSAERVLRRIAGDDEDDG
jgi:hypothetical protein